MGTLVVLDEHGNRIIVRAAGRNQAEKLAERAAAVNPPRRDAFGKLVREVWHRGRKIVIRG